MLRGGLLIFPDAIGAESCPHPSPLPEGEGAVRSGAESGAILKRLRRIRRIADRVLHLPAVPRRMALSEAIPIAMVRWVSQAQPILRKAPRCAGQDSCSYSSREARA